MKIKTDGGYYEVPDWRNLRITRSRVTLEAREQYKAGDLLRLAANLDRVLALRDCPELVWLASASEGGAGMIGEINYFARPGCFHFVAQTPASPRSTGVDVAELPALPLFSGIDE